MNGLREKSKWGFLIPIDSKQRGFSKDFENKLSSNPQMLHAWKKSKDIYQGFEVGDISVKGLTLQDIKDAVEKIDDWFARRDVSNNFPYPITLDGFASSLALSIQNDINSDISLASDSAVFILAHLCPDAFKISLDKLPSNIKSNPEVALLLSCFESSSDLSNKKENITKDKNKGKKDSPAQESEMSLTIRSWLRKIKEQESSHDLPLSVLKTSLNGYIKESVIESKGVHENSLNYWFEDIALPAILNLKIDELKEIVNLWPKNSIATFVSPSKTMGSGAFLRNMVGLKNPEREYIAQSLLPKLIDGSSWSAKERANMLESMVERTTKHPWLFKERLGLWMAWGGKLDMVIPNDNQDQPSLLKPKKKVLIEDMLRSMENEGWNEVIDEIKAPQSPTPSKPKFR